MIKIIEENKITKRITIYILLFSGSTTIDIIDVIVYIGIIDRRSRIKFLKRMRCDRDTILHCRCIVARYSFTMATDFALPLFAGIRNWAGIPRYELIPACRCQQRSYRHENPRRRFQFSQPVFRKVK